MGKTFSPGPDGAGAALSNRQRRNRAQGMTAGERLTSAMDAAAPVQQFTPDQKMWRDTLGGGQWNADAHVGANVNANMIRQDPTTGCCDLIRMEPDNTEWIDLGGRGARDFAAGRP